MIVRPLFLGLLLGVLALGQQVPPGPWRWGNHAVALGLVGVALAYLFASPAPLGRRRDGAWHLWALPINWFNFAALELAWRLWRRLTSEDPWNEVAPGLYVGRRLIEPDRTSFEAAGPWAVLDCTAELREPPVLKEQAAWLAIPTLDGFPPTQEHLQEASAWLGEQAARGHTLYVHCAVGHGRSATAAAAYLLQSGAFDDVDACLAAMKERRRWIHLRPVQRQALVRFVKTLNRP